MIKADANIIGTINRNAIMRTDKNNNPYMAFAVSVKLPSVLGHTDTLVSVYVSVPEAQQSDTSLYTEGKRVAIHGEMDIHKKEDNLTFFLTAKHIATEGISTEDSITGTLSFRGHLRTENVYQERVSRLNQKPFLHFSAYSSEKDGENFVNTWVNFIRFPEKDAPLDSIKEEWMKPKAHIQVRGIMELDVYKGKISINSRVLEMSEYVKSDYQQ